MSKAKSSEWFFILYAMFVTTPIWFLFCGSVLYVIESPGWLWAMLFAYMTATVIGVMFRAVWQIYKDNESESK